jgi:hypothetical protein
MSVHPGSQACADKPAIKMQVAQILSLRLGQAVLNAKRRQRSF